MSNRRIIGANQREHLYPQHGTQVFNLPFELIDPDLLRRSAQLLQFVGGVFEICNDAEIEVSKLADTRSSSADVKDFAAMLVKDH